MPAAKYPSAEVLFKIVENHTYKEAAKILNCSHSAVFSWCKKYGITVRHKIRKPTYALDCDFFEYINTPEKAYILGYIAADGCVSGNALEISTKHGDDNILIQIRNAMKSTAPISIRKQSDKSFTPGATILRIRFCSYQIVEDLCKIGITPKKTFTLQYPSIPKELDRHFIRGFWDGDGSIDFKRFSCLCASTRFLKQMHSVIKYHTGQSLAPRCYYGFWRIVGYKKNRSALQWMYQNNTISLNRKYNTYLQYWQ